ARTGTLQRPAAVSPDFCAGAASRHRAERAPARDASRTSPGPHPAESAALYLPEAGNSGRYRNEWHPRLAARIAKLAPTRTEEFARMDDRTIGNTPGAACAAGREKP